MARQPTAGEPFRVLELFCGIGGVSATLRAAVDAGVAEVVSAVDIHRGALRVYAHNFDHPTRVANLEGVSPEPLRDLRADLWWMSPPCQPFTRRGKRRDAEDPRTRALLRLVDALSEVRPRYVALENVPGFEGSQTHARLREALAAAGYAVREQILCPSEFGVPNRRRRFFLVAGLTPAWAEGPSPAPQRCGEGLSFFLDPTPEPGLEVDPDLLHRYRHAVDVVDADDPRAVTATFTSAYGRSPVRSGSFLRRRDGSVRHFSPREILRLLGFPESYRLPPGLTRAQAWRLVGNSLSLAPVRAMLSSIPELACYSAAPHVALALPSSRSRP